MGRAKDVFIRAGRKGRRLRWKTQSTEDLFGAVYAKGTWGSGDEKFCSGEGSDREFGEPYARAIARELAEASPSDTLVDLGCGDFRVGRLLLEALPVKYIGVDVAGALIEHHRGRFGGDRVNFLQRDIATQPLPDGDYCLIRQVLQHLSNAQIAVILPKLQKYRRVVVTEHYPGDERNVIPNVDKVPGPDVRSPKSGVYLDQPPFDLHTREILSLPWHTEAVRTFELRWDGPD